MLKEYLQLYKKNIKLFLLDIFANFGKTSVEIIYPMIASYIIDTVIPDKNIDLMVKLAIISVALYVIRYGFSYIVSYYGHVLGTKLETDLRKMLFDHYETLSFSFFDENKTGGIISRLTSDLFDISEFSHHGPEDLFTSVFILIASFVIMVRLNVTLSLMIFLAVPVMTLIVVLTNGKWEEADMAVKKVKATQASIIEDSFSGVRVVKAFANEKHQSEKFYEVCDDYSKARRREVNYMALFYSNVNFFMSSLRILVISLGGYFIYTGQMTVGVLVQFTLYISLFEKPIMNIVSLAEDFQKAKTGLIRCYEILHTVPSILDSKDAIEAKDIEGHIVFDHVSFAYKPDQKIIDDISLDIKPGESIAIVGPSGAGKTTLSSLVPRFYDVTDGKITIDGIDVRDMTQKSLRENIGIVQQDVFLFDATIKENICYGKLDATDEQIRQAAKFANLEDFIESLPDRYDTLVGERGVMLSGGQKQRVAIARIFLKNPPILILDEATSSLDNENEKIIQESFDRLSESRTTIVIAHRLQTIENSEKIIVMKDGKIIETGDHESLLAMNGVYAKLYTAQKAEGFDTLD